MGYIRSRRCFSYEINCSCEVEIVAIIKLNIATWLVLGLYGCAATPKDSLAVNSGLVHDTIIGNSYHLNYENGSFEVDIIFTEDSVTWSDSGKTATDSARMRDVGNGMFFVNWQEKDGTFVTLLLDINAMKVYNSVLSQIEGNQGVWFMEGSITRSSGRGLSRPAGSGQLLSERKPDSSRRRSSVYSRVTNRAYSI